VFSKEDLSFDNRGRGRAGTGVAAGHIGSDVAGKTGTTDDSANAWFIGYTPNLTTALWMGYPTSYKPMSNYYWDGQYFSSVQGGGIPAILWHNYMAAAIASEPQYAGTFTPVYYLAGRQLPPPSANQVLYPLGLGTTTTTTSTVPSTTTTASSVPSTVTTRPATPPSTAPPTTTPRTVATTTTTRPTTTTTRP
jgi:membrane peptidoglycan carboxypeptidase